MDGLIFISSGTSVPAPAPPDVEESIPDEEINLLLGEYPDPCVDGQICVYRATDPDGPYTLLDCVDSPDTEFTDTTAEPGIQYYYKTKFICGGVEGPFSGYGTGCIIKLMVAVDAYNCNKAHITWLPCSCPNETDTCQIKLWMAVVPEGDPAPLDDDDYTLIHTADCDDTEYLFNGADCNSYWFKMSRVCTDEEDVETESGRTQAKDFAPNCPDILWQYNHACHPGFTGGYVDVASALAAAMSAELADAPNCFGAGTWEIRNVVTICPGDPGYAPNVVAGECWASFELYKNNSHQTDIEIRSYDPPPC